MGRVSKPWAVVVFVWVAFIFFTSTTLAQQLAETTYDLFTGQSSAPHPDHGLPYLFVDKGFHVTIFCIFGLLLCRTLVDAPRRVLVVVLAGAFVGSCSEVLQSFFPGRDPAIHDVVINIAGTTLGVLQYSWFVLKRSGVPAASTSLQVSVSTSLVESTPVAFTPGESGAVKSSRDGR